VTTVTVDTTEAVVIPMTAETGLTVVTTVIGETVERAVTALTLNSCNDYDSSYS